MMRNRIFGIATLLALGSLRSTPVALDRLFAVSGWSPLSNLGLALALAGCVATGHVTTLRGSGLAEWMLAVRPTVHDIDQFIAHWLCHPGRQRPHIARAQADIDREVNR